MNNSRMEIVNKKRAILMQAERGRVKLTPKELNAVKSGNETQIQKIHEELFIA